MPRLMVSISGVRGVYGDGLDDGIAEKFAFAFARLYPGTIVVGRDSRISGEAIAAAVVSGIRKAGCDVVDLGLASTPTTEMAVPERSAAGGIIITASHNPAPWNGLKFLGPDGIFLDSTQARKLINAYKSIESIEKISQSGSFGMWDGGDKHHIDSVLALDVIDRDAIAAQGFTVCVDTVNGAGGPICRELLNRLGCNVHMLNGNPTGNFAHTPEPVPRNIRDLCEFVRERRADIGFAVDPDVDRLAIVNEKGVAIGEEYTLAFIVDFMVEKTGTDAACNLSTSRMVDDAAERHGRRVHRSPIGEINVVVAMKEAGAAIGGEGNGGIILPALHYGRDAVLGIALMLQMMTERGKTPAEMVASIPSYALIKEKADLAEGSDWKTTVKQAFDGEETDERDGVKVIFPDSWVHVRASNTEPIVRIFAEAPTEAAARELITKVRSVIS